MSRKGQATVFIIIGIVIVLLVVMGLVFKDKFFGDAGLSEELIYPNEIQEVVDSVQECIDGSSEVGVKYVSSRGGFSSIPTYAFSYEYVTLPYYYYLGEDFVPSLSFVEGELGSYTKILIEECVIFSDFTNMDIIEGELVVDTQIINNSIEFLVDYPLEISVENITFNVYEPYSVEVDANLGWLFSVSQSIITNIVSNPEEIDLDFLLEQGVDKIKYIPYNNDFIYGMVFKIIKKIALPK